MNNFDLMNAFSKLMQQKQSVEQEQNTSLNNQSHYNIHSDYPEVFFTNNKSNQVSSCSCSQNNANQNMGSMFNIDSLKTLLPLLFKGNSSSGGIGNILQNLNPGISQIFSALSKKEKKQDEKSDPIIDLSEYTETN